MDKEFPILISLGYSLYHEDLHVVGKPFGDLLLSDSHLLTSHPEGRADRAEQMSSCFEVTLLILKEDVHTQIYSIHNRCVDVDYINNISYW